MPTIWDAFLDDLKENNINIAWYSLRDILELFWNYENNQIKYHQWLKEHK